MRKTILLLGTLALAGCGAAQTTYLRLDGQDIAGNPTLRQQLDLDRKACENDGEDKDCMAVRGYVSVPKDQAAAKHQQLAAIASQNAEVRNAVVLPPPTPNRTAVAKKQKSNPPAATPMSSQH
jgi:hypothetical protein